MGIASSDLSSVPNHELIEFVSLETILAHVTGILTSTFNLTDDLAKMIQPHHHQPTRDR